MGGSVLAVYVHKNIWRMPGNITENIRSRRNVDNKCILSGNGGGATM